jgi:ribose transport system substrate-binding protein
VFTNDDGAKGVQAMTDILAANPDLDAFGIMGGWPLFGAPQPYRDLFKPMADKIAKNEFVIGAADTIGDEVAIAGEGLVTALVGQRPFEMGYKTMLALKDMKDGKAPPTDPTYTGLDVCTPETADTCIAK